MVCIPEKAAGIARAIGILTTAEVIGNCEFDIPEGSRYIQLSETLARAIVGDLQDFIINEYRVDEKGTE